MIPQETVQQIIDTARIEEVVSDFVTLKRRGANYVACCPFHNEKTPSFYVSPAKGIYKCFGCGKAGSAVGFVMEHEHCSYVEALRYIARKYRIEIVEEEESAEEIMRRQRSESLLLVSEFAQKFFTEQLHKGEGLDLGYAYFRSRDLEDSTIGQFGLGWAPSGQTTLLDAARAAGYKDEYLLGAGLAVQREDGSLADKFRERVMFPIHSVSGRVIAFSGRTLRSDNPAKYVNSPDTDIYKKSNILFGIWFAKSEIARQDACIIVEGNVDLVMLHQLGIRNVVAPCGTSLTVQQIRLIRKFTSNIILMNDGDSAGIHASLRDIDLILQEGLNMKIVLLPDGEDPDSYARKHTLAEMQGFIASGAKDFLDFKSDLLLADAGGDPLRKANLINDLADTVARIPDAVKRTVYLNAAAEKFGVESDIILQRVNRTRTKLLEDERKENERARREAERAPLQEDYEPVQDFGEIPPEDMNGMEAGSYVPENRILAPIEAELLGLLLTYGDTVIEFETDSPFYDPEVKPTVASLLSEGLEQNGFCFVNSGYRAVYEAYMKESDAGVEHSQILSSLLNSPDRLLARVTADNSIEKYRLSVQKLQASMTSTSSWLANGLPKAILTYAERRLESRVDSLRRAIPSMKDEEQVAALKEIVSLQRKQGRIKKNIKEKFK
ncbi:MAG: DNA primase [Bacteroidales bacterium]|nr:DNA primase [Bacteroidales bacterium]